jgi:hypothetical protein
MNRLAVPYLVASMTVCMLLTAAATAQTAAPEAPVAKPAAPPACTYSSKTYSDGAFVCVQKSLALRCTVDEAKATWAVVTDKDLSDKCQVPAARGNIYQQRARWHRRNIARQISAATDSSPRCFTFNSKRYCE